jgi:hypothetical protein
MQGESANLLQKGNTRLEDVLGKINLEQLKKDSDKRQLEILREIYDGYEGRWLPPETRERAFNNWLNSGAPIKAYGSSSKSEGWGQTSYASAVSQLGLYDYMKNLNFNPTSSAWDSGRVSWGSGADHSVAKHHANLNLRSMLRPYEEKYRFNRRFKYDDPDVVQFLTDTPKGIGINTNKGAGV